MRRRVTARLDRPRVSVRVDLRVAAVLGAALLAMLGAAVLGLADGDFDIPAGDVAATLVGAGTPEHEFIVLDLRLPRVLLAILVGCAFGLAGALLQSLARNPLVAPDIIGIDAGAALAAVAVIVLGLPLPLAPAALTGALCAAALLYLLAYRAGVSSTRLVLVGVALNATFFAGVSYLLARGDILEVQRATLWLIGSVHSAGWADVRLMGAAVLLLVPAAIVLGRHLDALQLGDDLARGLGARVERIRLALILIAVALAASAVSVVGPIAFVAFIAPHIARRTAGTSGAGILPAAAAIGGLLVLASDLLAQRMPTPLPAGIVTSILGAPYFLLLLRRAERLGQAA